MKRSVINLTMPLFFAAALFSSAVFAEETSWPEITADGLHRVTFSELSVVYLAPDADLGAYDRIRLLDPLVRFRRNWQGKDALMAENKSIEVSPEIAKTIREKMSREFRKVFTEKLESGGYDIVQEDGDDVLLIRPAIINLKVVIPKDAGTGDSALIIRSAGDMTLFLEGFDSVSGELLAKGLDRKVEMDKDTVSGDFMYFWAASEAAKNTALIDHAFASWADSLVEALNVARSH